MHTISFLGGRVRSQEVRAGDEQNQGRFRGKEARDQEVRSHNSLSGIEEKEVGEKVMEKNK